MTEGEARNGADAPVLLSYSRHEAVDDAPAEEAADEAETPAVADAPDETREPEPERESVEAVEADGDTLVADTTTLQKTEPEAPTRRGWWQRRWDATPIDKGPGARSSGPFFVAVFRLRNRSGRRRRPCRRCAGRWQSCRRG